MHKLRRAMVRPGRERLAGVVEVDETYWGAEEEGVSGRQTERFDQVEFRLLADSLILVRERLPVAVCAYCFMPDHVHAILFPQDKHYDFQCDDAIQGRSVEAHCAASRRPGHLASTILRPCLAKSSRV